MNGLFLFSSARRNDPHALMEGTGRYMRHVKLRPDKQTDEAALTSLIRSAYADMQLRLQQQ